MDLLSEFFNFGRKVTIENEEWIILSTHTNGKETFAEAVKSKSTFPAPIYLIKLPNEEGK